MASTIERTTKLAGLEQFLPVVPKTAPLAPTRAAVRQDNTPKAAQRRKRKTQATAATAQPAAPQAPLATESQESRRAKTVRMGQARMVNLLRSIRLMGNLSSSNYEWHEGEVARMKDAAMKALNETFSKFDRTRSNRQRLEDTFQFTANEE